MEHAELVERASTNADEVRGLLDRVESLEIRSGEDYTSAADYVAAIKSRGNEVKAWRDHLIEPAKEQIKRIDDLMKPAIEGLKVAEGMIKTKIGKWATRIESRRDELLTEAGKAADDPEAYAELIAEADAAEIPKVKGMSLRHSWTGQVVDAARVVKWCAENGRLDLLRPDESALRKATTALEDDPTIDGWQAEKKTTVTVRS